MTILDDVKTVLRVSGTDLDSEITDLIDTAKADLFLSGIVVVDDTDPLIKRALIVYCKANFGWDNPEAERLQKSYDMLKSHLLLTQDYNSYTLTFTVTDGENLVDEAGITIDDETKTTNSKGVAVFVVASAGVDVSYIVTKIGYQDYEGSIYIDGSKELSVTMVEVV